MQAIIRPNPEALQWTKPYSNTGKTGPSTQNAGAAYGWQGLDYPDGDYPIGDACVTVAGTLLRTYGVSTYYNSAAPIYINRVPSSTLDAGMAAALSTWTSPASGMLNVTREAISCNAARCRLFYVKSGGIYYRDSTNDGVSWGAETLIPNTSGYAGVSVLASPDPSIVFICQRKAATATGSDPQVQWLEIIAVQQFSSSWYITKHPKPTRRTFINRPNNAFWDAAFSFTAATVDAAKEIYSIILLDDLAGRPASTIYQGRTFSDFFSVEAIDFAEPERDEVIGMKASKIGNKIILSARRTMSDSDFINTRQGVIYYSLDGKHWSDAYFVTEATTLTGLTKGAPYNWGKPVLFRNKLWLVGADSIWEAPPTPLFGGSSPALYEIDVTNSLLSLSIDEPDDGITASMANMSLDNGLRAWLAHPLLVQDSELEIRAGYDGYFSGINLLSNPSFEVNTTGWAPNSLGTIARSTLQAYEGAASCLVTSGGGQLLAQIATSPGIALSNRVYTFSAYLRRGSIALGASVQMAVIWSGGAQGASSASFVEVGKIGDDWFRFSRTYAPDQPDRTTGVFYIKVIATGNGQTFYFDGAQLQQGQDPTFYISTAPFTATEMISLYQGGINQAAPSADPSSGTMDVTASDYIANIKQGELDRPVVYPSPLRQVSLFGSQADLDTFLQAPGAWDLSSGAGVYYARAINKGYNWLQRGTGSEGELSLSARMQINNPAVGSGLYGAANAGGVQGAVAFSMSPDMREYYVFRFGQGVTRWELWRNRISATGSQAVTLLATVATTADIPDPPINAWFRIGITQQQQRILVWFQWEDSGAAYPLLDITDPSPLVEHGMMAVRALLPVAKPDPLAAFATLFVDDVRVHGHDPETSIEEFLHGLAVQKGFDAITAPSTINELWSNLSAWTTIGTAGAWTTDASGLHYNGAARPLGTLWALRHTTFTAADAIIDLEVTPDSNKSVGSNFANANNMGIIGRATADGSTRVHLFINCSMYADGRVGPTMVALQVWEAGVLTRTQGFTSIVPLYTGWRTKLRFVVDGPWYAVYINDCMAAMFYEPRRASSSGYWGLANAQGGFDSANYTIHSFRIPALAFGDLPLITAGSSWESVISGMIEGHGAYMIAQGRTLKIGKSLPTAVADTASPLMLLNGGYQRSYDAFYTHFRVLSRDAAGNEISGTVYSQGLWAKIGRPRFKIEKVDALRTAQECRDRAWQLLIEQERALRQRAYEIQPRLRWERQDLITVTNPLDDTSENLYLVGISRSWDRDPATGKVVASMTARLEEQDAQVLSRSTQLSPL